MVHVRVILTYLEIIYIQKHLPISNSNSQNIYLWNGWNIYIHALNLYNDKTEDMAVSSEVIVCVKLDIKAIFAYEYAILYIHICLYETIAYVVYVYLKFE